VFKAIKIRRSIRYFREDLVEKDKIKKILEAARLAPSALNRQPWRFLLVSDPETIDKLNYACFQTWNAPYLLLACADPRDAWIREDGEEYWKIDTAIAMQNLVLAATEEGLGTCWASAFNENDVKSLLDIPEYIKVLAITPIGYPAEDKGKVKDRKPIEKIVHYDQWKS
jgi:nitroreductase